MRTKLSQSKLNAQNKICYGLKMIKEKSEAIKYRWEYLIAMNVEKGYWKKSYSMNDLYQSRAIGASAGGRMCIWGCWWRMVETTPVLQTFNSGEGDSRWRRAPLHQFREQHQPHSPLTTTPQDATDATATTTISNR